MRLTLRTLLAYMDEILEPADRDELAKKVESSEFAHDLIHRTKDTMRRLRLSAPQVVGTGMGLDPNTVAEYLDNVLPPDSVADFERICLESDVHLAEVASAHHVLTMVLGEPAEVDPAARQRMYTIPAEAEGRKRLRIEPAHIPPAALRDVATVTPPPSVFPPASLAPAAAPHNEVIPDYLRASAWSRYNSLLVACAALLLVAVTMLLASGWKGWFGKEPQLASKSGAGVSNSLASATVETPDEATETVAPETDAEPSTTSESTAADSVEADSDAATTAPPMASAMPAAPPRLLVPSMGNATPPASTQEPAAMVEVPPVVAVDESAYGYGETNATPAEPEDRYAIQNPDPVASPLPADAANVAPLPTDLASSTPTPPAESSIAPPVSEIPPATEVVDAEAVEEAMPDRDSGPPTVETIVAESEAAGVEQPPATPAELGTYLDGKSVLLRFDPQLGAWFRLMPRATLHAGDKLLALPAFYPKLTLASGLHLKLAGGTQIALGPLSTETNQPTIDVVYGKVVIVNTANEESGLKLTIGTETSDVKLSRNATLGVEVTRKYEPGLDPRKTPSPIVAELYVRDGEVTWTGATGSQAIPAPSHWSIDNGLMSAVSTEVKFPEWIDEEPIEQRTEQMFGAPLVESSLDPTLPVEGQLLQLYQSSRRREVKSLVARSSVYAGLFVPFVEALRDSDQKSSWKTHVDTLRSAMALGPDSAEKIYQTLVDQRGQAVADDLYQMLCGFSPAQIGAPQVFQNGLAVQLVEWMENDSLDYRVLAVQDMSEITGMRLMPNPARTPTERAPGCASLASAA